MCACVIMIVAYIYIYTVYSYILYHIHIVLLGIYVRIYKDESFFCALMYTCHIMH